MIARRLDQLRSEFATVTQGAGVADRLKIARILVHAHSHLGPARSVLGRLPADATSQRVVHLRDGRTVHVRLQDAIVLYEHFGLDVYGQALDAPGEIRTIVDLGANIGYATLALAARYPGASFVCVEPAAPTRALLEQNLAANRIDAQVFGVAVVGEAGSYAVDPSHYAAANQVVAVDDGELEGITLGELLDRAGVDRVDLLKIDIEGAESAVFDAAEGWADRVRTIIGEVHEPYTAEQAARALEPHGYRRLDLPSDWQYAELVAFTRD